jgi:hypothetical protein
LFCESSEFTIVASFPFPRAKFRKMESCGNGDALRGLRFDDESKTGLRFSTVLPAVKAVSRKFLFSSSVIRPDLTRLMRSCTVSLPPIVSRECTLTSFVDGSSPIRRGLGTEGGKGAGCKITAGASIFTSSGSLSFPLKKSLRPMRRDVSLSLQDVRCGGRRKASDCIDDRSRVIINTKQVASMLLELGRHGETRRWGV